MHSISIQAVNSVRGLMVATALMICQHSVLVADSNPAGIAVVSSRSGKVLIAGQKPKLHQQLTFADTTLQTGIDSTLFLVMSNGVAISLGPNTELCIERYTQKPFPTKKESQQYEPSESKLQLTLTKGSLCCAFEHLSPLSEARIETPHGELRIHSGNSILVVDSTQTQINMFSGTATFYYPNNSGRAFISDSQSTVIDATSTSLKQASSTKGIEQLNSTWHKMAKATEYARVRILFQGSDTSATATPVFVLPEDYLDNPIARPYHFKQRVKR